MSRADEIALRLAELADERLRLTRGDVTVPSDWHPNVSKELALGMDYVMKTGGAEAREAQVRVAYITSRVREVDAETGALEAERATLATLGDPPTARALEVLAHVPQLLQGLRARHERVTKKAILDGLLLDGVGIDRKTLDDWIRRGWLTLP